MHAEKGKGFDSIMSAIRILRLPRHNLATFGATNVAYFLITEKDPSSTRIREGRVISQRPKIIVPTKPADIFEGFGEKIEEYAEEIFRRFGSDLRIMEYRFKNEPTGSQILSGGVKKIVDRILEDVDRSDDRSTAVIQGSEAHWQASLMKFIVEMTLASFYSNITELSEKGFFDDPSVKKERMRSRIESLFAQAEKDRTAVNELGKVLSRSGLFEEYEDRFFTLFGRK